MRLLRPNYPTKIVKVLIQYRGFVPLKTPAFFGQDVGGNLCQDCLSDPITCNPADRNPGVQSAAERTGRFTHRPRKNENALYKQSSLTVLETKMHYIDRVR